MIEYERDQVMSYIFKVSLNTAWNETLYEINITAFSDERSLIQSFYASERNEQTYAPPPLSHLAATYFSQPAAATYSYQLPPAVT